MSSLHILKYTLTISNILTTFQRLRFQIKLLLCWIFPNVEKETKIKHLPFWRHKATELFCVVTVYQKWRRRSEYFQLNMRPLTLKTCLENFLFWMQSSCLTSSTCACVCCSRLLLVRFGAGAGGPPSPSGPPGAPPASGVDLHHRRRKYVVYYVPPISLCHCFISTLSHERETFTFDEYVCMSGDRRTIPRDVGDRTEWLIIIDRLLFSGAWLQLNFEFTKYWCSRFLQAGLIIEPWLIKCWPPSIHSIYQRLKKKQNKTQPVCCPRLVFGEK